MADNEQRSRSAGVALQAGVGSLILLGLTCVSPSFSFGPVPVFRLFSLISAIAAMVLGCYALRSSARKAALAGIVTGAAGLFVDVLLAAYIIAISVGFARQ